MVSPLYSKACGDHNQDSEAAHEPTDLEWVEVTAETDIGEILTDELLRNPLETILDHDEFPAGSI